MNALRMDEMEERFPGLFPALVAAAQDATESPTLPKVTS